MVEKLASLDGLPLPPTGPAQSLNLTIIYEDAPTRQWALEFCDRVTGLVGKETVHATWWKLGELREPAVLAGAVSTTLRADAIVVAIRAAERFPLPFYVWVDSWLPHHSPGTTTLIALITLPERPRLQLDGAREYLKTVARHRRMAFLLEERKVPGETRVGLGTERGEPGTLSRTGSQGRANMLRA